jgi:hypothetical protein
MKRSSHGGLDARKVYVGKSSVNIELDREAVLSLAAALIKAAHERNATVTVFTPRKRVTVTTTR